MPMTTTDAVYGLPVLTTVGDERWRSDAACQGHPPEWWFPEKNNNAMKQAREICDACPVRTDCLEWALVNNMQGIWGGVSHEQRAALRKERGFPTPCRRCGEVFAAGNQAVMYCGPACKRAGREAALKRARLNRRPT